MKKVIFIALLIHFTIYALIFISCEKEEFILDETIIEEAIIEDPIIENPISKIEPDISKITYSNTSINIGDKVYFKDISENSSTSWLWYFGDGYYSTKQNPYHVYKSAGIFTVTFIASNATDSDTIVAPDHISAIRNFADKPNKTENLSPSNISVDQSVNSLLKWLGSDPNGYELSFNVYLDTIDGSTLVSESQTSSSFEALNLKYNTTYYWRIVSENTLNYKDTGDVWSFNTRYYCFDVDGNEYNSTKIGNQVWMTENLRTTSYADGKPIDLITKDTPWNEDNYNKSYCWYNDDKINFAKKYGALYSGAAAVNWGKTDIDTIRDICPDAWHLPTDNEWKELEMFLGMNEDDANRMLYRGTSQGSKLSSEADLWDQYYIRFLLLSNPELNSSGFNAAPGGYFESYFTDYKYASYFWSSSFYPGSEKLLYRSIKAHSSAVYRSSAYLNRSMPVRCIMD